MPRGKIFTVKIYLDGKVIERQIETWNRVNAVKYVLDGTIGLETLRKIEVEETSTENKGI